MNRGTMREELIVQTRGTPADRWSARHFNRKLNMAAQDVSLELAKIAFINYGRESLEIAPDGSASEFPLYGVTDFHSARDMREGPHLLGGRWIDEREISRKLLMQDGGGCDSEGLYLYTLSYSPVERTRVTINEYNVGTFSLTFGGATTSPIAYNSTPAAVQTALNLLSSVAAVKEVQTFTGRPASGAFKISVQGTLTVDIAYNASNATIESALQTVTNALEYSTGTTPAIIVGGTTTTGPNTLTFNNNIRNVGDKGAALALVLMVAGTAMTGSLPVVTKTTNGRDSLGVAVVTSDNTTGGPYNIVLTGKLAGVDHIDLTADGTLLRGGTSPTITVESYRYSVNFLVAPPSSTENPFIFIYNLKVPEIPDGVEYDSWSYSVIPDQYHGAILARALELISGPPSGIAFASALAGQQRAAAIDDATTRPDPEILRS